MTPSSPRATPCFWASPKSSDPRLRKSPRYLRPYRHPRVRADRGVGALLWEDLHAQQVRFQALARNCPFRGRRILDVGCGRADFLDFLLEIGQAPSSYVGLEAQPWLARAARRKGHRGASIVEGDFLAEPGKLLVDAQVVVFSGSLNFLSSRQFYRALRLGWAAASESLAFNFLCSSDLAAPPLTWHRRRSVAAFARRLGVVPRLDDAYEPGDCTVVLTRRRRRPRHSGRR